MFKKYLHVERYGNDEVQGIELGELSIFPKLDGTNASTWLNTQVDGDSSRKCVGAGSRTRELSLENDNAGFCAYVQDHEGNGIGRRLYDFHFGNPNLRLYGEWLVPHTLKTYRDDAWRRFWVFDVFNDATDQHLDYRTYQPLLEGAGLDYIPPLAHITNGDYEYFIHTLNNNNFFIKDGQGIGEGIVLKNYNFYNKFGRQAFAKIVTSQFKEQHYRTMGAPESERTITEEVFANEFVDEALCTKIYAKICNDSEGWNSRYIPRLLETAYHDLVTEELWSFLRKNKNVTLNFSVLRHFVIKRVKEVLPHLF